MRKSFVILGLSLLGCGFAVRGADTDGMAPTQPAAAPVLVEIDGVKLTLADFGRKHPGGLF